MPETSCPRCGNSTESLQPIDPGLRARLTENGQVDLPAAICSNCFDEVAGSVARGSVLLAREKAREQHRLMLWKSRVAMIKKARLLMQEKAFSEAAVAYEKYLRVLEVVFEVKPGELKPEHFKDSARTQELTVVASTYWDLLRIYDTSEKYGSRMKEASTKLALFLRFTPIYPDIMKRAEAFSKSCKNQSVMKGFLKAASDSKEGCFIATSAFGSVNSAEVVQLRRWRDENLLPSRSGNLFVHTYYQVSPGIARFLNRAPYLKGFVRAVLRGWIRFLKITRVLSPRD